MTLAELDGKVAVVTGGAGGIGWACAQKLADAGAAVVIADTNVQLAEERSRELENGSRGLHLDVTDSASSVMLAAAVSSIFGRVDILVNNAGLNIGARNTADVTDEEFDTVMSVNVRGTFMTTRAFIPALIAQAGGSIINMSSAVGHRGVALVAPYSAAKAALKGLTESLASELAPHNIRVNSVHPGMVATALHTRVVEEFSALKGISFDEAWEAFLAFIPLGRFQTADDIGDMVAFLASPKAGNITGSAFDVDGGLLLA